jgi:hypothetical protein
MSLLNLFDRDHSRSKQDAVAPLAPLAPIVSTFYPGRELTLDLAEMRGCVGDHALLRRSADEDAAIVEMVLSRLVAGRQLTPRGIAKVREDLRDALAEAGVLSTLKQPMEQN